MKKYVFTTVIKQHKNLNAAYVEFPYNVENEFGKKGQIKVVAKFDGHEYRGSLVKMKNLCHWIGITQEIRNIINKNPGDKVEVEIYQDSEPREIEIPDDLKKILSSDKNTEDFFNGLSFTHKKEYVRWITEAKKTETRNGRLAKTVQMLKDKIKHP